MRRGFGGWLQDTESENHNHDDSEEEGSVIVQGVEGQEDVSIWGGARIL